MDEFAQCGCVRVKVAGIGQNWLFFWAKVVIFGQSGLIRVKVVVLGQKWL